MATEKVMSFRVFSTEDEDKDYTDLDKFHIDTAVFFNGKTFFIFSDVINKGIIHRGYRTSVRNRSELGQWLSELGDITLVGYNSTKLDYQLLAKAFSIDFRTVDLMDAIGLTGSEAFGISKRRYPLREVVRWNGIRQSILPHLSWIFNSVELFEEWFNQRFRGVAKSLCAECEMVARLAYRLRRKGMVRIIDPDTGRAVALEIDLYDHTLPRAFFSEETLKGEREEE